MVDVKKTGLTLILRNMFITKDTGKFQARFRLF